MSLLATADRKEARQKGRALGNVVAAEVLKVLDEAIEEWRGEHTTMLRDDPWVTEYVATVRRETLMRVADKLYLRA